MFHYNPKSWFNFIINPYSRQVMRTLLPALVFLGLFSWLFCYISLDLLRIHEKDMHSTIAMHSLLGIVLGLFLVFRTNSAYDRWWEGRKLWGLMVNNTRNLAHKIDVFLEKHEERQWFARMIPNLAFSIKEHLRDNLMPEEFIPPDQSFTQQLKNARHIPNKLSNMMYQRLTTLYKNGTIDGYQFFIMDKELKEFSDILGGCERIKNTPIPYSYAMYIKKFLFIYIITLPLGFITIIGYMTIFVVVLLSFLLLSIELIAEEIEEPFGRDANDLATDSLCVKIRQDVEEILIGIPTSISSPNDKENNIDQNNH